MSVSMLVQISVKIHTFVLKILSGNEVLTSFNGRNSVSNWRKWTFNNPKLDVVNINASAQFRQNTFIYAQDIERKEILTSFKGRNSVTNWRKWTLLNNPKLDVVNINAYAKFDRNLFIRSQDIERKQNSNVIQGP